MLTLLALSLGCTPAPPEPARVAVIGMDGGDWDILDPLIADGLLPNLGKLRDEGFSAPFDTRTGFSPVSWTSIASGHWPDVHGVTQNDDDIVQTFSYNPSVIQVRRLWDMVGSEGRRSFVSDYWITGPAYPMRGVMLSRETQDGWPRDASFKVGRCIEPEAESEALEVMGLTTTGSCRVLGWLDEDRDFDLLMVPIYTFDQALHRLYADYAAWIDPDVRRHLKPQQAVHAERAYTIVLETARYVDEMAGELMEYVGDNGYVMLVSDHGHTATGEVVRRIAISRRMLDGGQGTLESGELAVRGGKVVLHETSRSIVDPIRTLSGTLRYPELELVGDLDYLKAHLLNQFDPSGAQLFAEQNGRIVPTAAAHAHAMNTLGQAEHGAFTVFVNSGGHGANEYGVFGVYGPGVDAQRSPTKVMSVDALPTALYLMGLPVPEDVAGTARTEVLKEGKRMVTVPTYEDGTRPWAVTRREGVNPEEIEKLKALGYL